MKLSIKVNTGEGDYVVETNLFHIVQLERKYKVKASDLASGISIEMLGYLAHERPGLAGRRHVRLCIVAEHRDPVERHLGFREVQPALGAQFLGWLTAEADPDDVGRRREQASPCDLVELLQASERNEFSKRHRGDEVLITDVETRGE